MTLSIFNGSIGLFIKACLFFGLLMTEDVHAKRIALVMGNDNYTSVSKLQKAGNDATAMARELKAAGFTVQLHRDLNYRGMVRAVEAFTNNITGGDEVVVFFAGHGVQIKNGSYLLPTDIEANSESEVEKTAYELLALTDKISEAKPAFSLVMVDACRDNPLKSKGRNIGNARGLSAIEPPKGQMVVYSASRGQQALDRLSDKDPNPNGVFTREFITQMQKPGVRIEDIMRSVQDSVETLAKSVSHEQRPAVYNEARGNFYFFGPTTVQVTPAQQKPDTNAIELALWESVKNATTAVEIQAYLNRFPNGFFAEVARVRIDVIGRASAERVAAENNQRLAGEAKVKEQQRLALEAQNNEKARLAQESEQKEQVRILAEQRIKEHERAAAVNAQKLALDRIKEEAKRSSDEKLIQDAAERIALTIPAVERANRVSEEKIEITKNEDSKAEEQALIGSSEWFQLQVEDLLLKRAKDKDLPRKIGLNYKDCEACPEMVVIAGNTFLMGSESGWFAAKKTPENEQPQRSVSLKTFSIGRYEVTQKEWREIMGTSPSHFRGENRPVEQVSWEEVQVFLQKLSLKTGNSYRLPTEAEWEYAALGNQQTEFPSGSNPSLINKFAWYSDNSSEETHAVGGLIANKFGLFDMYGNVDELTSDCFNPSYKNAPTDGSSWNLGACDFRIVRGGSWHDAQRFVRTKSRFHIQTKVKSNQTGFRVVRDFVKYLW